MLEILKFSVAGGFWHFVGCWCILGLMASICLGMLQIIGSLYVRVWKLTSK